MTTSTTPDGIIKWTNSDPSSIVGESQAQADSIQLALAARSSRTYAWANVAERSTQTGMRLNDFGFQADTLITYRYNGTSWRPWESDWIAYTPTLTNFTLGTGGSSNNCSYKYIAGRVLVHISLVYGSSGGAITASPPRLALPVPSVALSRIVLPFEGRLSIFDASITTDYEGVFISTNPVSTTQVDLAASVVTSSIATINYISGTMPFVLGTGDSYDGYFWYDPA